MGICEICIMEVNEMDLNDGEYVNLSSRVLSEKIKSTSEPQSLENEDLLILQIPNELMNEVKNDQKLIIMSKLHQYKLTLTDKAISYVNEKQQKKVQYNMLTNEILINGQHPENHNASIQDLSSILNTIGQHCLNQQAEVRKSHC